MALGLVVAVPLIVASVACQLKYVDEWGRLVDAVNRQLPVGEQFSHYAWYWSRYTRLRREYRRLYPSGELYAKAMRLRFYAQALMLLALLSVYVAFRLHR